MIKGTLEFADEENNGRAQTRTVIPVPRSSAVFYLPFLLLPSKAPICIAVCKLKQKAKLKGRESKPGLTVILNPLKSLVFSINSLFLRHLLLLA